jgi:PhnB protein
MLLANYLFFTAACEPALAFYTHCGLGKVTEIKRYDIDAAPAMRGKIMHARFEGPGVLFYASDNHDAEPMRGSAHFLMMDDREQTDRFFNRLAEGGTIDADRHAALGLLRQTDGSIRRAGMLLVKPETGSS